MEEESNHLQPKCNRILLFPFCQEYEATRRELESVKREREEAKRNLSALKHSQAPMIRKINEIKESLQPIDDQIKSKVKKNNLRGHFNEQLTGPRFHFIADHNHSWWLL